jgi:hypothetical protein
VCLIIFVRHLQGNYWQETLSSISSVVAIPVIGVRFGFWELSFKVRNYMRFYEEVWVCNGNIFRGIMDLCLNKWEPYYWVYFIYNNQRRRSSLTEFTYVYLTSLFVLSDKYYVWYWFNANGILFLKLFELNINMNRCIGYGKCYSLNYILYRFSVHCCNSKREAQQTTIISCDRLRYISMLWMGLIFNIPTKNRI